MEIDHYFVAEYEVMKNRLAHWNLRIEGYSVDTYQPEREYSAGTQLGSSAEDPTKEQVPESMLPAS